MVFVPGRRRSPAVPLAALLALSLSLAGCTGSVTRHIVRGELSQYREARVVTVNAVDGREITFAGDASLAGRDSLRIVGVDLDGKAVVLRRDQIVEAEIVVDEPSLARTWALGGLAVVAATFLTVLMVIQAWST
jgi:hypothetical protein